jgi:hypothetical protein
MDWQVPQHLIPAGLPDRMVHLVAEQMAPVHSSLVHSSLANARRKLLQSFGNQAGFERVPSGSWSRIAH